ncbi:rhomboid family intramembrane serine protease [Paenibacillus flagellatus]|uniref:Rhomboid family intramembrane serine protease n=1 Tax=Paenibacillus flagellatus TaxID=2211139 RepID=A0A2V5KBU1_9BACL|nr:rhomboid family intramembrane serine protease [Paenibacillus flagellatus]PYI56452.1 rhomboid family intramembrane serine protease [Paenibacillus flagellatus]
MLFLRYESFRQYVRWYPVTTAILAVQLIMYLWMEIDGSTNDPETLLRFGALVNAAPFSGDYWRYFASQFLHSGFSHLLFNSFSLFVFAPPLERLLGKWKYAVFYLGSGFIGNLAFVLLGKETVVSVGASGSIYGVFAAYLFIALFFKKALDKQSSSTIKTVVIVGFIYSFLIPQINLYAHIGGFIGGFLLFAPLFRR